MKARASVLAAALLLVGCAQVPTSGPVVEVDQQVPEVGSTSFVRVLARPPRSGMTPTQIVQGFLDAASGFEDNHSVAKMYLTPAAARQWNPSAGARVYGNGTEALTADAEGDVTLAAARVAAISPRGQYVPAPSEAVLNEQFGLVQQDGQWRIESAPQGLLLSRAAVERSFREFQTYYVAEPGGILAPDPVLFVSSRRDVVADLVRALLSGPGAWLRPAVSSGFPPGTTLNAVSVTDGVVQVDLSAAAGTADDLARQQMSAQLVWTLRQVPSMRGVVITVDGLPLAVPGAEAVQPRTSWPQFDPEGLPTGSPWYLIRDGQVLTMNTGTDAQPVPGVAGSGDPAVRQPLVSLDGSAVAATDQTGRLLTTGTADDAQWRRARTAGTSAGGSWDRTGLLWLPDPDVGVQVVNVLGTQKVPIRLDQVRSVQVSRDGSRAVVVAGPRDGAVAYLMRVDRTSGPPTLSSPRQLVTGPVVAATWSSATEVCLLVTQPDQPAQVAMVDLGLYSARLLGGPPRARTVAAAPDRPVLSGTADGQIWQFNGSTWTPLTAGRQPRYPG